MKKAIVVASLLALISSVSFAAAPKTYQVTGTVLSVTGDMVTVQKGTEKWEIALPPTVKVIGDMKAGSKVTIMYTMTATSAEVKADTKAAPKAAAKTPKATKTTTPANK